MAKSCVVIKELCKMDYTKDYVALPKDYPKNSYFEREDIKAIRKAVFETLDELDEKIHFTDSLRNYKHVLIKPNLVTVYHNTGFRDVDYPETTDPRVFEAVVAYIKHYNENIIIVESSGKPVPTAISFKIAGYHKISKYYNTGLVALERQSVVRYLLPKAEVMKEVYIPEIFDEVIKGESYYISVPKMKTNLYTGVTLGFKNAMGTIPYFLRERNHNYNINKKLTDLLYLFKPDLVLIDGIIGGEGNTPAPVDPVEVGMIIAGNNSVEVDRITTHMMGFDPDKNELMREAVRRGFHDDKAEIIGTPRVTKFRPADASLMSDRFIKTFPNILGLAGHTINNAPAIEDINKVTTETAYQLEQACVGGCLASICMGLDYVNYGHKPNYKCKLAVIMGSGVKANGTRYWFDRTGKPYSVEDIKNLKVKRLCMGNCPGSDIKKLCEYKTSGCCDPLVCATKVCRAAGMIPPPLSIRNKDLIRSVTGLFANFFVKCKHICNGRWVDVPRIHVDKIFEISVDENDKNKDYIHFPLPKMTFKDKLSAIHDQLSLFVGCL